MADEKQKTLQEVFIQVMSTCKLKHVILKSRIYNRYLYGTGNITRLNSRF